MTTLPLHLRQLRDPEDVRVLIGCECSGRVRDAFLDRGFDAWSCDLKPDENGSNRHMREDIRRVLDDDWDFLAVMHPPCTRLCNSGVRWLSEPPTNPPADSTAAEREEWPAMTRDERLATIWRHLDRWAELFSDCWNAPIPARAIENPIMNPHARERIASYRPPAQTVQPWWFGDPAFKGTSFWLESLPPLVPTNKLTPPAKGTAEHREWSAIHRCPPGPDRARIRSRTFPGIAAAMAAQWGDYLLTADLEIAA